MSNLLKLGRGLTAVVVATSVLSGCSYFIKSGANVALKFGEKHIVPPILKMDDVDMVCNAGNSLTPVVMSTKTWGQIQLAWQCSFMPLQACVQSVRH